MIGENKAKLEEVRLAVGDVPLREALSPLEDETPLKTIESLGQLILKLSEPFKALEAGKSSIKLVEDKAQESQDSLLEVDGVGHDTTIQEAINALRVMASESGGYGEQMELMKDKLKGVVTHLATAMRLLGEYQDVWHVAAGHVDVASRARTVALDSIDSVIESS